MVFNLALYIVTARQGNGHLLGVVGMAAVIGYFGVAWWFARRGTAGAPGTNSFAFAGAALLALALPQATGSFLLTLPVISLIAIVMAIMSRVWENGGFRAITYLLTIYCCGALAACLHGDGAGNGCHRHAAGRSSGLYRHQPLSVVPPLSATHGTVNLQPLRPE